MDQIDTPDVRERLRRAVISEVAERRLGQSTVGGVVRAAGVSREQFYDLYGSVGECYEGAVTTGRGTLEAASRREMELASRSIDAFEASLARSMAVFTREPELARCMVLDPPAGADAAGITDASRVLATVLERLLGGDRTAAAAYSAMLRQMVKDRLLADRLDDLHEVPPLFAGLLRSHIAGRAG